ncbi:MAG: T9SS type A sorting domain-containing protein [Candidatus Latescibacteria bacterium]|nr:T9SS type A sorting domain-containing protein [Candidatus Latescibacterota bacterium]
MVKIPSSRFLFAILFSPLVWVPLCHALQAGVARVDISPRAVVDVPMSGYTHGYDIRSQGLHDSLFARVVVLEDGETAVALASLDLIGLNVDFNPWAGRLPRLLRAEGLAGWLMVSTHTHGGPRVLDLGEPYGTDRTWPEGDPYTTWMEDRLVAAVQAARANLQPVRLSVGQGRVGFSFNRRLPRADGTVEMIWGRAAEFDPDQLGPTDPEVGVVRIDDLDGKPLAVLFNYACHAVVLGGGNRLLTADFPGYAMGHVEEQVPGAIGLFLQGAAGDLDPFIDVQNNFAPALEQGRELGGEVVRVVRQLAGSEAGYLEADAVIDWIPLQRTFSRFYTPERSVNLHFGVLMLGRRLAFLGLPGEPFVELQLDLKSRSPIPHTFLLGYANGYAGYFPTIQANKEGGYGASYGGTMHVEASAGEAMVAAALEVLERDIWVRPWADTLTTGTAVELVAVLRPVLPGGGAVELVADLRPLGGPERTLLKAGEDELYRLAAVVGPDLPPGRRQISIYWEDRAGQAELYLTRDVVVLPGADLTVWDGGVVPGWRIEGAGGAQYLGVREVAGSRAAAFRLAPQSTASVLDFWTVDLLPEVPVATSGYQALRFRFHPGTTAGEEAPRIALFIGDRAIDLDGLIDFGGNQWQAVEIALDDLDLAEVERIRFWGWMGGTFYLDGLALSRGLGSSVPTQVGQIERARPVARLLQQNFPNPFNQETTIGFALTQASPVDLAVFNLAGQRLATLARGYYQAGTHMIRWRGGDEAGRALATGLFLYRLEAGARTETRKLLLLR